MRCDRRCSSGKLSSTVRFASAAPCFEIFVELSSLTLFRFTSPQASTSAFPVLVYNKAVEAWEVRRTAAAHANVPIRWPSPASRLTLIPNIHCSAQGPHNGQDQGASQYLAFAGANAYGGKASVGTAWNRLGPPAETPLVVAPLAQQTVPAPLTVPHGVELASYSETLWFTARNARSVFPTPQGLLCGCTQSAGRVVCRRSPSPEVPNPPRFSPPRLAPLPSTHRTRTTLSQGTIPLWQTTNTTLLADRLLNFRPVIVQTGQPGGGFQIPAFVCNDVEETVDCADFDTDEEPTGVPGQCSVYVRLISFLTSVTFIATPSSSNGSYVRARGGCA